MRHSQQTFQPLCEEPAAHVDACRIALLAGAAVLGAGCSAPAEAADRAAIEALRAADVVASLAQDYETLATFWTRDGVMLAPGSPPLRGAELFARLRSAAQQPAAAQVLDYAFEFEELTILGDHAWEWGVVRGTSRTLDDGEVRTEAYKLLRILRREDGVWRVHRAIWNELAEPAVDADS